MASLTTTPVQPVAIVEPKLNGGETLRFWIATAILFQFRTLIVWGFLATFFPALGVTWFMVMFGLYAIKHAAPVKTRDMIRAIVAQRK